jgi:serine phosphatase RsbU (regulator of sigma subunit)
VLFFLFIHFQYLFITGGLGKVEALWVYAYPVVCFILEDFRKSVVWISIFISLIFCLVLLHFLNIIKLPYNKLFLLSFIPSLFAVSGLLFITERVKSKTVKHIQDKDITISKELNLAKKIQQNYMCSSYESFKDIEANVYFKPMMEVGGDIFDIVRIKNGYYRIFIADAAGHGIQAALVTMIIKTEYDRLKYLGINPSMLLEILNNAFIDSKKGLTVFFSCAIADLDINKGKMFYAAAGHPHQFLLTDNEVIRLKTSDFMLGVEHIFRKNYKLTLFTDGVSEIKTKKVKKIVLDEIKELLLKNLEGNTVSIIKEIKENIKLWSQEEDANDDITLICLEHK